jgi:hypothetical protein
MNANLDSRGGEEPVCGNLGRNREVDGIRRPVRIPNNPVTEFLIINSTKDSKLLLYAIPSPFYFRILKKIIIYCGLTYIQKNRETRKLESIHE